MKQVLVIEDDVTLSQLLTTVLQLASFKVEVALTGNDGIARLEQSIPDAIVLDLHLPGVSGRAIYEMLEQRDQAFRVLICSADVQLVDEYKAKGAKAMAKPIERLDEFTALIGKIVEQPVVCKPH